MDQQHRFAQQSDAVKFSMNVYRELMNTARMMRREISGILKDQGLTSSQYAVLDAIPEDGIPLSGIAKRVWREPSNITGIVDRLEQSGWLYRGKDPSDRRVIRVYKTEEGNKLNHDMRKIHPAVIHKRMSVLTDTEKALLVELVSKLQSTYQDFND